jgi:hypothetical protein
LGILESLWTFQLQLPPQHIALYHPHSRWWYWRRLKSGSANRHCYFKLDRPPYVPSLIRGSCSNAEVQARITTKYNIPNLESPRYQKSNKRKRDLGDKEATAAPAIPRAVLTLKTYDPDSGVCLRFKTDKAADVGRLVGGLGRLGRHMAALPQKTEGGYIGLFRTCIADNGYRHGSGGCSSRCG